MSLKRRLTRSTALAALLGISAVGIAIGCAIDWPTALLGDRNATLSAPYAHTTEDALRSLTAQINASFKPVETPAFWGVENANQDEEKARRMGLWPAQLAELDRIRELTDGDEALIVAKNLPKAVALYEAGAADLRGESPEKAAERFQEVLNLPAQDQILRATWAAFMLGKLAVQKDDINAADAAFAKVRDLTAQGLPDFNGLAVASLGEQARPHYRKAKKEGEHLGRSDDAKAAYLTAMGTATRLYAQMAAQGSVTGVSSLLVVARHILGNEHELNAALDDADIQALLLAYYDALWREGYFVTSAVDPDDPRGPEISSDHPIELESFLALLRARMDQGKPPVHPDSAAMLAYQAGQYDLAARFAAVTESPMALWVQGKLAYQAGDLAKSLDLTSRALQKLPAGEKNSDFAHRLSGEHGVLTASRGDFIDALGLFYAQGTVYWQDVAYLAEDVLSIDEIKKFVDGQSILDNPARAGLRDLLARRLVRAQRFDEALPYFEHDETRAKAAQYAAALREAVNRRNDLDKAEAWFEAASIARHDGMEIMGTELAPDFFYTGGSFDDPYSFDMANPTPGPLAPGEVETKRRDDNQPHPLQRFHYRYIAVDHALAAADLLPPRSQAYAAALCEASHWMFQTGEDDVASAIYRRYVANGALVPFAEHFGWNCPDPDFVGAKQTRRHMMWQGAVKALGPAGWLVRQPFLPISLLSLIGAFAAFRMVRRSKR